MSVSASATLSATSGSAPLLITFTDASSANDRIFETGSAADTITESGSQTNTYTEGA